MRLADLKNKSILILGFGREGKATLEFLKKHLVGEEIGIADKNDGENYLEKLNDYDVIIKSPGIPYFAEIKKAQDTGKVVTSATQIFFDNFKGTVIGVTGTKGKSTTASLIYEILKSSKSNVYLIGNIGTPALGLLDILDEESIVVYELSSFQLENLKNSPHIAVMTNIYPEHLDHHGDFQAYMKAKSNITQYQTEEDYLIYNEDIPELKLIANKSKAQKLTYSIKGKDAVMDLLGRESSLLGEFNLLNAMPAILIGRLFKIPEEKIKQALINFKPLPHRLEFVADAHGIKFYNDSLSTIPQATIAALSALGADVETLIVGGFDRGIDYSVLGPIIASSNIKNLILFPETGAKIWQEVQEVNRSNLQKFDVGNMEDAVEMAFKVTKPGKICLLSPASSSFNMFKDYADRGNQFKKYIALRAAN